ncbi:MAG: hypothetical protein KJ062_18550, partial [Thermoanaerobaculia bacterium]|nr:hypothetical protein [Thermoanaerobaculia bacterium]
DRLLGEERPQPRGFGPAPGLGLAIRVFDRPVAVDPGRKRQARTEIERPCPLDLAMESAEPDLRSYGSE